MADVGKKTGKQTQAGRDVYETPEGEMVSEKSTTFEYKGKWINIPTIHGGKQYSEDQLIEMLDKGLIKPTSTHDELEEAIQAAQSRSDSLKFNKGGTPMLEKQMELFEDGGLRDEGGMVDEESGNEVPVGSTRKEVRDDIPAMLSEGEFVFPADVVRYIGLENLMRIRQDAKQGLKQMEAMGQMGNGDEAILPDDMPFGMMDLIIIEGEEEEKEPQKKAQGGVIHAQQGTFVTPMFDPSNQDVREYKNKAGNSLFIPFLGGEPVYPIPAGYFPAGQMPTETEAEAAPVRNDDDGDTPPPPQSEFQKAGGWSMDTSATDGKALDMWIKEAEKVSTFGNVAAGIGAAINPLMGGLIALSNKQQKKQIVDMLDEKIAQARKTPIEGQVAALQDIKKRLTTDEGKGILAKVIDEITGTVTDALGLSEEEKKKSNVGAKVNATQDPNESDTTTENKNNIITNNADKVKNPDALAEALSTADEAKIAGSTLKEDGTYDISSWFTDTTDVTDLEALSEATTEGYDRTPQAPTAPEIYTEKERTPIFEGTPQETGPLDIRDKATELGADISAKAALDRQAAEDAKTKALEPAYYSDAATQLRQTIEGMRNVADIETALSTVTNTVEEVQSQTQPTIDPTKRGSRRQRRDQITTPTTTPTPAPTPTPSGGGDDDGPSFAGIGDLAASAKEASKNVKTTVQKDESGNVTGVTTTGGTAEEQQTMQDYVTSAAAGAKGGLFKRRKK